MVRPLRLEFAGAVYHNTSRGDRREDIKIAHEHGSTVEMLRKLNPGVPALHPDQVLRYQKVAVRKVIVGWKPITPSYIGLRYNIGDSLYGKKLDLRACAHPQGKGGGMRTLKTVFLLSALAATPFAIAANKPFTGVFHGEGRACFGGLFIRTKTIEWNSSFSKCGSSRYEILDQDLTEGHPRIVYRLLSHRRQCRHAVIGVAHYQGNVWDVKGYPSVEAYRKRESPGWKDSVLPERAVTSCGMLKE